MANQRAEYIIIDNRPPHAGSLALLRKNPTWQEVQDWFHLGVNANQGELLAGLGEQYWKFIGVSLQEGPTVYRVEVRGLSGSPMSGVEVVRHYSSAPYVVGRFPMYHDRGVVGRTEYGGDKFGLAEFVYSGSSYITVAGGPDSFWVISAPGERLPSDMAYGFGWDPRTNHFNPSPIFQLTTKGATVPEPIPEPDPEPSEAANYRLAVLGPEGRVVGYEQYEPGMPPKGQPCWVVLVNGAIKAHRLLRS